MESKTTIIIFYSSIHVIHTLKHINTNTTSSDGRMIEGEVWQIWLVLTEEQRGLEDAFSGRLAKMNCIIIIKKR